MRPHHRLITRPGCWIALAALGFAAAASANADDATATPAGQPPVQAAAPAPTQPYYLPPSISPQARAFYERMLPIIMKGQAARPVAHTAADFQARRKSLLVGVDERNAAVLKKFNAVATDLNIGGVPVVEIRPLDYRDDGTLLIRVHGGGFVQDSAHSALGGDALMTSFTGKRIISVDYTVAPEGRWPLVTDQVVAVYKALLAEGHTARSIGIYGDSAGGDIVACSTLKLRDQGLPIPGALVLMSPAADLSLSGDTFVTLANADPVLTREDEVRAAFALYADPSEWRNPYVSPVYGDFSKTYPPTLIQAGTKERMLSDSVRLYQAIKTGGGEAELDIYEGMAHVFQAYMNDSPEQKAAYTEIRRFWDAHLVPVELVPAAGRNKHKKA
jgi:acetyl esterase/lipase